MSAKAVSANRQVLRALARWPKDTIRPQVQLQDVVGARYGYEPAGAVEGGKSAAAARPGAASAAPPPPQLSDKEKLGQANALLSLLGDRYKRKYPITGSLLTPKSNPTYYDDLIRELEEAPTRSWLQRILLRVKGIVRLR